MLKVIIAGGRDFTDYNLLSTKVSHLIQNKMPDVAIISGLASGADSLGAKWATGALKVFKIVLVNGVIVAVAVATHDECCHPSPYAP